MVPRLGLALLLALVLSVAVEAANGQPFEKGGWFLHVGKGKLFLHMSRCVWACVCVSVLQAVGVVGREQSGQAAGRLVEASGECSGDTVSI